jgi:hypothetical protein
VSNVIEATIPFRLKQITFIYGNHATQQAHFSVLNRWVADAGIQITDELEKKIISRAQDELNIFAPNALIKAGCAEVDIAFWTNGEVKIKVSGIESWKFSWSVTFDAPKDILEQIEIDESKLIGVLR